MYTQVPSSGSMLRCSTIMYRDVRTSSISGSMLQCCTIMYREVPPMYISITVHTISAEELSTYHHSLSIEPHSVCGKECTMCLTAMHNAWGADRQSPSSGKCWKAVPKHWQVFPGSPKAVASAGWQSPSSARSWQAVPSSGSMLQCCTIMYR